MATDYATLKVPDLKKLLNERGLAQSGNKADLISRLQDDDKEKAPAASSEPAPSAKTLPVEDEIDWGDDNKDILLPASKSTSKPVQTKVIPAPATASVKTSPAKPVAAAPAASSPAKIEPAIEATKASVATTGEKPVEEIPANNFALGLEASNADAELKKREARAKRFGITEDPEMTEEAKKLERAKKFGVEPTTIVKGLDEALPERRPKRGREHKDEGEGGGKRQTPDRRGGGRNGGRDSGREQGRNRDGGRGRGGRGRGGRQDRQGGGEGGAPKKSSGLDAAEKAKAEARAKRFGGNV